MPGAGRDLEAASVARTEAETYGAQVDHEHSAERRLLEELPAAGSTTSSRA